MLGSRIQPFNFLPAVAFSVLVCCTCPAKAGTVEGFAEAFRHIEVATGSNGGLITEINVREGDTVRAGQIVAKLDTSVLEASLDIAQRRSTFDGRLDAAVAEKTMRQRRLGKLRQLAERGHASPAEINRAEADLAVATAQVKLAEEERELAELECHRIQAQIEERRLRSPIDGVVVEVFREVGESTQISEPRLLTLVQLNPLRVKFPVSVEQSKSFEQGNFVTIQLPEFRTVVEAEVEVVAPVFDAKSGTVQITCLIQNADGQYRSGMRCLMEVEGDAPQISGDEFADEFESDF